MPKIWRRPDLETTEFQGMVTTSESMTQVFHKMKKVGSTDATVLIRGATGTGKELVARAIHNLSHRRQKSFSAVNCATFSSELMASELFGHVRGAFTGALTDHKGVFEVSHGGSLFLDEIAEIPIDIQARLLRVLQDGTFTPVGGTHMKTVDIRLISATHKSLREAVESGMFREDLMYRVRVIPLFLPKLTERHRDVEVLMWRFIDEFTSRGYDPIQGFTGTARDALLSHSWPGNVRELRNVIEYIAAMHDHDIVEFQDLPPDLQGVNALPKDVSLKDLERERLLTALAESGGHRGEAAKRLNMDRSTLWRKLREHRLA